jgi:hypothetical protein
MYSVYHVIELLLADIGFPEVPPIPYLWRGNIGIDVPEVFPENG